MRFGFLCHATTQRPMFRSRISQLIAIGACAILFNSCESEDGPQDLNISTSPGNGVTDADGNSYATVVLGNGQEWMAENLRTTSYRNGEAIPEVASTAWTGLSTGAYCAHTGNTEGAEAFGLLYNFHAVSDARNVCPEGWHVPTEAEWDVLTAYLDPSARADTNPSSLSAGGHLKASGTAFWNSPNTDATNLSGFNAVGGGFRSNDGTFQSFKLFGYWWTANENTTTTARNRNLYYGNGQVGRYISNRRSGLSVRCVKD